MQYTTELTTAHREFLEKTFGNDVKFDQPSLRVYASDASNLVGKPLAAVCPTSTAQVQALLKWADEERIVIHPRGRGTSLSGGCVPDIPGIVVSLAGMDKILDISTTDFVATIEPGVNTAYLQQECAKLGLFYPPDPASSKASSVGGNVMTCAGGLRAVKYGVTRDYVLGCEVVLPGGKLLKLGGRTQKDVVGLDMTRFLVGSEGTLGIITKLYLKLLPKPSSTASILVGYSSLDDALVSMGSIFAAGILPSAVEFMNELVLEILKETGETPWPKDVDSLLLLQVDGSKAAVEMEIERLSNKVTGALWKKIGVGEEEDELWSYRRKITSSCYVLGPDRIGGDIAVPRGQILNAVRRFEELAANNGKRLIAFGHAGDGNIHANLHYDATDKDDAERTMKAHEEIDVAALEFDGTLSGEHGIGCIKNVGLQLGKDEHEMMLNVRSLFDPNGILNPRKGY